MCLVLVKLETGVVTIAANRDEWFHRPTTPAKTYRYQGSICSAKIKTHPPFRKSIPTPDPETDILVYGSRDEQTGNDGLPLHGSPFLISSDHRWAVITNASRQVRRKLKNKTPIHSKKRTFSRGHIVTSFVCSSITPMDFLRNFDKENRCEHFEGFNLIFGIGASDVYFMSNCVPDDSYINISTTKDDCIFESIFVHKLRLNKCYGVSNSFLDAPEPRIEYAKKMLMDILYDDNLEESESKANRLHRKYLFETAKKLQNLMSDCNLCKPSSFVPAALNYVFIPAFPWISPKLRFQCKSCLAIPFILIPLLKRIKLLREQLLDMYGTRSVTIAFIADNIMEEDNGDPFTCVDDVNCYQFSDVLVLEKNLDDV